MSNGTRNLPAGVANASVDFAGNPTNAGAVKTYNMFTNDPSRAGQDKSIAALIAQTPLPNRFDFGDGLNTAGYNFTAPQFERQNDIVAKSITSSTTRTRSISATPSAARTRTATAPMAVSRSSPAPPAW